MYNATSLVIKVTLCQDVFLLGNTEWNRLTLFLSHVKTRPGTEDASTRSMAQCSLWHLQSCECSGMSKGDEKLLKSCKTPQIQNKTNGTRETCIMPLAWCATRRTTQTHLILQCTDTTQNTLRRDLRQGHPRVGTHHNAKPNKKLQLQPGHFTLLCFRTEPQSASGLYVGH